MKTTMNKETKNLIILKRVENVLRKYAEARDDDSILYTKLLGEEYGCSVNMRATTLEKRVAEGVLPSRDTATRFRRKLQRVDETLRGGLWAKRQAYAKAVGKSI